MPWSNKENITATKLNYANIYQLEAVTITGSSGMTAGDRLTVSRAAGATTLWTAAVFYNTSDPTAQAGTEIFIGRAAQANSGSVLGWDSYNRFGYFHPYGILPGNGFCFMTGSSATDMRIDIGGTTFNTDIRMRVDGASHLIGNVSPTTDGSSNLGTGTSDDWNLVYYHTLSQHSQRNLKDNIIEIEPTLLELPKVFKYSLKCDENNLIKYGFISEDINDDAIGNGNTFDPVALLAKSVLVIKFLQNEVVKLMNRIENIEKYLKIS